MSTISHNDDYATHGAASRDDMADQRQRSFTQRSKTAHIMY